MVPSSCGRSRDKVRERNDLPLQIKMAGGGLFGFVRKTSATKY